MRLTIDEHDPAPLHAQIAAGIRRTIADGEVGVGERLPPARDLAAALDVNVNTVLRAFRQVRDEGLVELRRGRGATVVSDAPAHADVRRHAAALVTTARRLGYGEDELVALVKELL